MAHRCLTSSGAACRVQRQPSGVLSRGPGSTVGPEWGWPGRCCGAGVDLARAGPPELQCFPGEGGLQSLLGNMSHSQLMQLIGPAGLGGLGNMRLPGSQAASAGNALRPCLFPLNFC